VQKLHNPCTPCPVPKQTTVLPEQASSLAGIVGVVGLDRFLHMLTNADNRKKAEAVRFSGHFKWNQEE
jgi:hypothetical protein